MRLGGIVLCGGRSSRMGRPKAWLPFGGEPMLCRVARAVAAAVAPVVVVAAPGQDVPPLPPGVEIVRDPVEGQGPLRGLVSGLEALRGRADAAYLSSCDVPFLVPAFVSRLIGLLGANDICVPRAGGFFHSMAAVYRAEVAGPALRLLEDGRGAPRLLFAQRPTRIVEAEELRATDPELRSLRNLNTPEDYEAALREV